MDDMNKQSKRFYEILDVIKELHDKKRHDYGANEDIFANFRLSELSGISAWQGSVVRMGDKYARISNFTFLWLFFFVCDLLFHTYSFVSSTLGA